MAETGRIRKKKLLKLPSGDDLYIPVISELRVTTPQDNYQETFYGIENGEDAAREVHVDAVYQRDAEGNQLSDDAIQAERIDVWKIIDPDRGQETQTAFDNKTGSDSEPPHFTGHQKTHVYRYYKNPNEPDDNGVWADFELIDIFATVDPDRGQEVIHTLNNPAADDMAGQVTGDLEDISDENNGIDAPLRVDPFQNLTNYNDAAPYVTLYYLFTDWRNHEFIGGNWNQAIPTYDSGVSTGSPEPGPDEVGITYAASSWSFEGYAFEMVQSTRLANGNYSTTGLDITPTTDRISHVHNLYMPTYSRPPIRVVSGSPLVVNGKTITGYINTLTVEYTHTNYPIKDIGTYYHAQGGTWWYRTEGVIYGIWIGGTFFPSDSELVNMPGVECVISPDPFVLTDPISGDTSTWQAIGVRDWAYFQTLSAEDYERYDKGDVYIVRV